jgi:hypothetical protein
MQTTRQQLTDSIQSTEKLLATLIRITQQLDITMDDVQFLNDLGEDIVSDDEDDIDHDDLAALAMEHLSQSPLEITEVGRRSLGGEWKPTGVKVVMATGGTHIELRTCARRPMWFGSRGTEQVEYPANADVIAYFNDLAAMCGEQ